jgi:hypothetical protein
MIVMNIKNLLLFSSVILLLVCCKDKDEIQPQQENPHTTTNCGKTEFNEIDNSLMQQFLLKPGTYWIYKDSVNNAIDSCFCYGGETQKASITIGGGMGVAPCVYTYLYAKNSISLPDSFQYTYYIQDKYLRVSAPFGFSSVFLGSNTSGILTGDSLSKFYPTITINVVSYSDVYKLHFASNSGKFRAGYFYLKPGVGIIKTDLYTSDFPAVHKVNELVRYHIE